MMPASTLAQYLAALPADRRNTLSAVRNVINKNLPNGYEEGMQFGMIGWYVPLSLYPEGYGENRKVPLPLVALGSQKSGMVLHFLCFYGHPTLRDWFITEWSAWERATSTEKPRRSGERAGRRANQYQESGKKLDMGKGCVRFKSLDDLALDVVGRTIARIPVKEHIANYRAARALLKKGKPSAAKDREKSAAKKAKSKK